MKLNNLKEQLKQTNESRKRKTTNVETQRESDTQISIFRGILEESGVLSKEPKIIGITGSKGKSTVAYLIHEYLKQKGYKSILYSSIGIDSKVSFNAAYEAVENPLKDEGMLLAAIEDAYEYETDYLILEVNERAIKNGLTKNIPFDIRLITNIMPKHNDEFYADYVDIKKSFFTESSVDENTTCIFSETDKAMFDSLYAINNAKKVTYMSKYVSEIKSIDKDKVNYFLSTNRTLDSIKGLDFTIISKDLEREFKSNLLYPHNAMNLLAAYTVLDTLGVMDDNFFDSFIKQLTIPGRDEVIKINNRTIIISPTMCPHLENLKVYQNRGEINKIKVLSGAPGLGFKTWTLEYGLDNHIKERENGIKFAYNYIKKYADKVYITTSDIGTTNPSELLKYQASFIDNNVLYELIIDRKTAIKKILEESSDNDCIFISGRGNRRVLCDSYDTIKLHLDKDVVLEVLRELGWR